MFIINYSFLYLDFIILLFVLIGLHISFFLLNVILFHFILFSIFYFISVFCSYLVSFISISIFHLRFAVSSLSSFACSSETDFIRLNQKKNESKKNFYKKVNRTVALMYNSSWTLVWPLCIFAFFTAEKNTMKHSIKNITSKTQHQ